jgi:lysophospholipase
MMDSAPLFTASAQGFDAGPDGGRAFWIRTADGVRLRMALWPGCAKGTVLLLPGRSEYIEKYARAATEFGARGYGLAVLDWRGQGLSDRQAPDAMMGHISEFSLYQNDLKAALDALHDLGADPRHLVSHSMGGCIALRALIRGLAPQAAVFSAPMWGIQFPQHRALIADVLSRSARFFGQDMHYTPGTGAAETYVLTTTFTDNMLTRDAAIYADLQAQARAHPQLTLAGPSLGWLAAALQECKALAPLASPDIPALCLLGTAEKVVRLAPIHRRMARWPGGKLTLIPKAEHEVMMEIPATRIHFYNAACALFDAHP